MPRNKGSKPRTQSKTQFKGPRKPQTDRKKTKPEARTKPESRYRTEQPKRAGKTSGSQPRTATRVAGKRPTRKKAPTVPETPRQERLQKIIATAGITSRRKAEELILEGRVTVNGKTVSELGAKADPTSDSIAVDGKRISVKGPKVYILLYKPKGYISSVSDEHNRPVVTQLVSKVRARVYPIGRLDFDAEGVLLLTNDGDLSNKLIHPTFQVPKTYLVKVKGVPPKEKLEKLEKGVFLEDGRTLPAKAKFIRPTEENSWIELTVFEGRNHLVKRMCMAIGHPVQKLKRVDFAGIRLGKLKPGEFRHLTEKELEMLKGLGK